MRRDDEREDRAHAPARPQGRLQPVSVLVRLSLSDTALYLPVVLDCGHTSVTGGWRGDAHTAPNYRGCAHEYVTDGRCSVCRAIPVDGFVQSTHLGNGATPLGSPNIMPAMKAPPRPTIGDGTNRARFNRPIK